jgi:hypothetical protein
MLMKVERVYAKLIKHPSVLGYYKHPTKPLWLSKKGDTVLTHKLVQLEPSTGGEYKSILKDHLHVLKLETFLVKPTNAIKLTGNHIDGDKHNCDIDNLEWTSYSGNLIHAYQNKLRNDNFFGFIKDLADGSIKSFMSLRDCAIWLGVNPGKVWRWLNGKRDYPFRFKHAIWLNGEGQGHLTMEDVGKAPKGAPSPYKVRRVVDDSEQEWQYFVNNYSAAKKLGIKLTKLLELGDKGENGKWEFEKIKDYDEYLVAFELDEDHKESLKKRGFNMIKERAVIDAKRVSVTNHLTGEVTDHENIYEFAKGNNFHVAEILRALKTKDSWNVFVFLFQE